MIATVNAAAQAPPTAATVYLQQTSDRYQHTVDVYTDADAAGNHFADRGEIDSSGVGTLVPSMDEISSSAPCFGITCITASFDPQKASWGGWYFLNGILGPTDRSPSPNWGAIPDAGYDLTGATTLQFWARGVNGGEVVEFFCFGVGRDAEGGYPTQPYPDSSPKISLGRITLTTTWTQYKISLTGLDIHYVLGGFGWVAAASYNTGQIAFYLDNIQYIKERPIDPRFLVSYETIKSNNSFDSVQRNAAFAYDNAVALIALTAAGDLDHARSIADAFLYAQSNDRFFADGRLRNAYQGGDIMLPPGWLPNNKPNTVRMPGWYDPGQRTWSEDETHVSSNTGNLAWAMLALLHFYEVTNVQEYLQAAEQLGKWVLANTSDNRGSGGFTAGYNGWENGAASGHSFPCASGVFVNGQCKRLYKSTEHNIDLFAAFSRLYLADHLDQWAQAAQQAKGFFTSMWDGNEGKFWTGTDEGGVNPSTAVIPVDIQAWAIQALGPEAGPYLRALDYVEAHHKAKLGYGFKQDGGNSCGDNTWFEGTSQVAVAYLLAGNRAKWQSILDTERSAQWPSGAMPATDGACLNTGFILDNGQPWEYFPRAHVGATAWLSLAENGINPFRSFPREVPGSLTQITVGSDGTVWGINSSNQTFWFNPQTQNWQRTPGLLTQIAVGANGFVWGLDAAGDIYRYDPNSQNWDPIPGNLSQIAVGCDGDVWGINSSSQIYHFNPATQNWTYIPGALAHIAVGYDGAVWGINAAQQIFRFNPGSQQWQQVPGLLTQIAVGADGDVWGINSVSQIFHFNSLTQSWDNIPGLLAQIAVGSGNNVWGVNAQQQIYEFNAQTQNWEQIPGLLTQIAVGANGSVWGINGAEQIYQFVQPTQPTQIFHQVPGLLSQIAVGLDGEVWGLNSANQIYAFNSGTQNWNAIPGLLTQIAVGFGGNVWGINAAGQIWRLNAPTQTWEQIPGLLSQIAVGANGDVWGLNSAQQIYRFNPSIQKWDPIPGLLVQLSVGADGTVWGINSSDEIYRFNSEAQNWDWIPGSLAQIAVGSANNVWGINSAGQIWQYNSSTQTWNSIPGSLAQIGVAFDGAVWGLNSADQIYRFNNQTQNWDRISGSLTKIGLGADALVWGLNANYEIYFFR
jgi:hypothetical protein